MGELVRAVHCPENAFNEEEGKLGGMHQAEAEAQLPAGEAAGDEAEVRARVYRSANVLQVRSHRLDP